MNFPNKFKELNISILLKRDAFFILFCLMLSLSSFNYLYAQKEINFAKSINIFHEVNKDILFDNISNLNLSDNSYQIKNKFKSFFIFEDSIINRSLKDTISLNKSADTSFKKKEIIEKFKMKKNPWVAVGLSAIFPGLGQIYNESYWKLPIVAFVTGLLGYEIFWNNGKYIDYRDKYAESQVPENPQGDTRLRELREFYRDQRDQNLLYFGFFYLINMADAYVDAHLYDFNVSEKISLGLFKRGKIADLKITF